MKNLNISAMCSYCCHFGRLTNDGNMRRHGHQFIQQRTTWHGFDLKAGYTNRETKKACQGSGLPPRNNEKGRQDGIQNNTQ